MSLATSIVHVLVGVLVGLGLARAHVWAVTGAARRALVSRTDGRGRALLSFPIRVAAPAAALFALTLLSFAALVGGAAGFFVGQRLLLSRLATPDPARRSP